MYIEKQYTYINSLYIMDPLKNPYSPGAGTRPPELAGRDGVIADVTVSLARLRLGRSMRCPILVGLRGVGKTVLLNHLYRLGKESSLSVALMEAPEKKSLPALLIPRLRDVLTSQPVVFAAN